MNYNGKSTHLQGRIKVFLTTSELVIMSHVAEIASAARAVSSHQMAQAVQKAQMNIIKMNIDAKAEVQMQMVNMLKDLHAHLGSNINIAV